MAPLSRRADPRVLFLGSTYAGHATRFANLRRHVEEDGRISADFRSVTGWNRDRRLERFPLLPRGAKGRLRATIEAAPVARFRRPDAIWTSCREELAPYFIMQSGPLRRPLVLDLDATESQLESMALGYFGRSPKRGWRASAARRLESLVFGQVRMFTPWSHWAADGLRAEGIDSSCIRVIPPGVDIGFWKPERRDTSEGRPLRLLFVGGDFQRKGGGLVVDAVRCLRGAVELALVTRDHVGQLPEGVRLVRAAPNSEELRDAYRWADLFVLPTRADCFGIATVEAMAAGLPVIAGDVGGVSDIVVDGATGWLIEPTPRGLLSALGSALANRDSLASMGVRARARAEQLFDDERNSRVVIDLLLSLAEGQRSDPTSQAYPGR